MTTDMAITLVVLDQPSLEATSDRLALVRQAVQSATSRVVIVLGTAQPPWNVLDPVSSFHAMSKLLSELYTAASTVSASRNNPLFPVDVVIDPLRRRTAGQHYEPIQQLFQRTSTHLNSIERVLYEDAKPGNLPKEALNTPPRLYGTTALGGTFDHLHSGHKILLTMAAWISEKRVIVGITDEVLLKNKKHRQFLQSLTDRTRSVREFLDLVAPGLHADLPPLQDVYGPTATDPDVQAMVVSKESLGGAQAVAKKRKENQLSQLDDFVIDLIAPDAVGQPEEQQVLAKLSSTGIRAWLATTAEMRSATPTATPTAT